ncbi:Uncharacterised protein [Shigella boydii]|nr:Uncharacterised protein [Shigella boydii]
MHATSLHSLAYRRFARNVSLSMLLLIAGEVNARSLQDNSKNQSVFCFTDVWRSELVTSLTHISWGRVFHLVRYSYFPKRVCAYEINEYCRQ